MADDLERLGFAIAYRMLGSVADAEDIVQEAQLRLFRAQQEGTAIDSPRAYLAAVTTRLAIDQLRSARARRESYVGTWLPEPVIEERGSDVSRETEMAESLSMAFLTILEALTPLERAVFVLREAFDYGYDEIAEIVGKSEANCRQLFTRARKHLEAGKPRFESSPQKRDELAERFFAACQGGDLNGLVDLLATDAAVYGDGGGKATAIPKPLLGRDRVALFVRGLFGKAKELRLDMKRVVVNGQPGAMFFDRDARLISVLALDISDGRVAAIRSVVNPDKLRHLGPLSDLLHLPQRLQ
ncbi:MAG TPA: RNA polymerase sigma-70 factor [Bryobacteraceae bacterium]|jgi:RNA polymerase sigma-70 factor (ECF subfamily)